MLAQNNEYLQEVVSGVRQLSEEEKIRQQCEARETNAYWERIREADRQRVQQELQDAKEKLANEQHKLIDKVQRKIAKGKTLEQIADELVESPDTIRPLYEELTAIKTQ